MKGKRIVLMAANFNSVVKMIAANTKTSDAANQIGLI